MTSIDPFAGTFIALVSKHETRKDEAQERGFSNARISNNNLRPGCNALKMLSYSFRKEICGVGLNSVAHLNSKETIIVDHSALCSIIDGDQLRRICLFEKILKGTLQMALVVVIDSAFDDFLKMH